MNPYEIMRLKEHTFTKKERVIYDYIINNSDQVIRGSIVKLAEEFKVSQPTITRFCQKLGFEGFNDFMFNIYRFQKQELLSTESENEHKHFPVLGVYQQLLEKMDLSINEDALNDLTRHIFKARRVFSVGMHKSRLSAELFRYNLIKFSINCSHFSNDDAQELMHLANEKDLVVVFSAEGESQKARIKALIDQNVPVALISMNDKCTYKSQLAHFIWLPNSKNQNMKAYTENGVIFMVFIDILTSFLAK